MNNVQNMRKSEKQNRQTDGKRKKKIKRKKKTGAHTDQNYLHAYDHHCHTEFCDGKFFCFRS